MTKYKEILKYRSLGYSQRQIADILCVSRNTVTNAYTVADTFEIDWVKASKMTEDDLALIISPPKPRESIKRNRIVSISIRSYNVLQLP